MKTQPDSFTTLRTHLEKFTEVNDDEFDIVRKHFTPKKFKRDSIVFQAGDRVQHTYWVVKGLLVSTFIDAKGKEHIIQFALENCWITDQDAYYNQTKAIFSMVCMEDAEVLSLSFRNREQLCSELHTMEKFFRRKANDSFVKQQRRLLTYLTSDAQKRFDLLLSEYPQLIQRLSKKTLAAYLGVSRETLSRFGK